MALAGSHGSGGVSDPSRKVPDRPETLPLLEDDLLPPVQAVRPSAAMAISPTATRTLWCVFMRSPRGFCVAAKDQAPLYVV